MKYLVELADGSGRTVDADSVDEESGYLYFYQSTPETGPHLELGGDGDNRLVAVFAAGCWHNVKELPWPSSTASSSPE